METSKPADFSAAPAAAPRHFSMIRQLHLADFLTLGNAASGMMSVFLAMFYMRNEQADYLVGAAVMAVIALIFDVFDGKVARWRHQHSILGRELDSLADIISFGVGPAALAFAAGMQGGWDLIVLSYFVCCGVSRLARFNVTAETLSAGGDKVKYFEGTPIPTSVLLSVIVAVCAWRGSIGASLYGGAWTLGPWDFHPFVLLFALSGTLMISKTLRIPKF
ncbi:CDP-alcohol phosphatidyltransferase family protein [Uliginosibacterium sp. H3]|uniref:CDP-alcohol phosphatidyltransferase family protein n=1 Tax=Uliginosibacterium silvisoli TaxID=3114758 RepID=A0ABU6K9K8_9RHOO|nr:CDP-alcohol phosphatidyltransferase family protein [Uliginosibacterium sp. H3]